MNISTGGGTMEDVQRVYDAVMPINKQLCILHCTSGYPCEYEELNLRVIDTLKQHPERFDEMAQRFSQCPSKDEGGSLGWVSRGQTVSELDAGIVYVTDVAATPGVDGIELTGGTEYPIALLTRDSTDAEAFVHFVLSTEGRAILAGHGFELP